MAHRLTGSTQIDRIRLPYAAPVASRRAFFFKVTPCGKGNAWRRDVYKRQNLDSEALAIGIPAMRIVSLSFAAAGVSLVCSYTFQATGSNSASLVLALLRQIVILLPLAAVLLHTDPDVYKRQAKMSTPRRLPWGACCICHFQEGAFIRYS